MPPTPKRVTEAARRLFASAKPILGTIAETYLHSRGISGVDRLDCLRFHPRCYHRAHDNAPRETWPALVAAVTDLDGALTGVLRTWLARDGSGKAPLTTPRRALGRLLGFWCPVRQSNGCDGSRRGPGDDALLARRPAGRADGRGPVLRAPRRPPSTAAAPLAIARDNDRAGHRAAEALGIRANADGIEDIVLTPNAGDFNTDLCGLGSEALAAALRVQLTPEDVGQFLIVDPRPGPRPRQRAPVSQVRPRGRPRPAFRIAMVPGSG